MPLPILWAHETWARFNEKFEELIGEQSPEHHNLVFNREQVISGAQEVKREKAGEKIAHWWRALRNSGKKVPVNPNGQHTQAFRTYLNNKSVKKRLSFDTDQMLLNNIQSGNLNSTCFQEPNVQLSLLNLFASGQITWQQKATLSSILEGQGCFGAYQAYPIVNAEGDLTEEARRLLLPFLHKGFPDFPDNNLTAEQMDKFLALVSTLPVSERYFFVFPHQKTNGTDSSPSPHNLIRETAGNLTVNLPGTRFLNKSREGTNLIASKVIPSVQMSYEGLLKLSFGAENALGLSGYNLEDWFALIPILAKPTIDNVDFFGHRYARPMISSDSIFLGLLDHSPETHGSPTVLSDVEAHDLYHRYIASKLGKHVHQGVERIIQITRDIFGFHWCKNTWLLRDFDLLLIKRIELSLSSLKSQNEYITKCFVLALHMPYLPNQLENCTPDIKQSYTMSPLMFTPRKEGVHSFFPHQMLLAFFIDLVRNPEIWQTYYIVPNEDYFDLPYKSLLKMTQYFNEQGLFNNDMKGNVLKLQAFIKTQPPLTQESSYKSNTFLMQMLFPPKYESWDAPKDDSQAEKLKSEARALSVKVETELPSYYACRDNRTVFLGFIKPTSVKQSSVDRVDIVDNRNTKKAKMG